MQHWRRRGSLKGRSATLQTHWLSTRELLKAGGLQMAWLRGCPDAARHTRPCHSPTRLLPHKSKHKVCIANTLCYLSTQPDLHVPVRLTIHRRIPDRLKGQRSDSSGNARKILVISNVCRNQSTCLPLQSST